MDFGRKFIFWHVNDIIPFPKSFFITQNLILEVIHFLKSSFLRAKPLNNLTYISNIKI